jgi:hypothetical protein
MDGFLTNESVEQTRRILADTSLRKTMVDHNYKVAQRYFSFARLAGELQAILAKPQFTAGAMAS